MAKAVLPHFPVSKDFNKNIKAFVLHKKKRISIYAIIITIFSLLDISALIGVQAGSRSYNFYLAILLMSFFIAELTTNWRFNIPIINGIGLIIYSFFVFNIAAMLFSRDVNVRNLTMLFQLPFYYVCAEIFYRKKYILNQFALLMTILGAVISILILLNYVYFYQTFGYFSKFSSKYFYYQFLFTNANAMGYGVLICMQFPLYMFPLVQKKRKMVFVLLLGVMTFSIIATQSRTAITLLAITLTIFFFKKENIRSRKIYLLIGIVVGFFLVNFFWNSLWYKGAFNRFKIQYIMESGSSELGRFTIWPIVIKEWLNHPFFGLGHEIIEEVLDFSPHNTYLSILANRGLFTFIPFIFMFFYFFRLSRKLESLAKPQNEYLFSALTGILIVHYLFSLTNDFPNSKFIWLIFSILTAERIRFLKDNSRRS